ncbi:SWIM zinc finger family protein [Paenibacillus montanisoli]|uniref:SWIM zinc finger family protein n=1 Tax=Paenibacillus montanisoli TaxID=2081970 RepID=A0A328TZN0_9BACL|nr:SWIM zinc finger family protein [Paenibacillus montanisoli]RAP75820.1 SWIM zinc finger family protein [Paenibacillus montanisoli]
MIAITEVYIDSLAPNAGAMKNGRDLVKKNSFALLCVTDDGTLLFGDCKGSGSEPYRCSVDFVQEDNPVFRCSCPSRQFPCKHTLGILYAYALGKTFVKAELPQDIADKREKAEKREEKKKEAAAAEANGEGTKPKRKVNKSALIKKMTAQLEGLSLLEKLILQLVHNGLGSLDKKTIQLVEDQAKQLGNYYIPGAQASLRELVLVLQAEADKEKIHAIAIQQLIGLHALVKKGRSYLEQRASDPDLPMDTESALEEQLGHAWQLAELKELGRVKPETELLQLSFLSYIDQARGEYVDAGWWADLRDGAIYVTRNLRPFRAAKSMKEEDTVHGVAGCEELFVYPGDLNARVRWERGRYREVAESDFAQVRTLANGSFTDVLKRVKNSIKNPLSDKNPVMLVAFQAIERIGDTFVLKDAQGKQLVVVANILPAPQPVQTMIPLLQSDDLNDQAALVMFEHDMESGRLAVQLLSIITGSRMIRLLY